MSQVPAQQAQAPVQYTAQNDPVTALANRYGMLPGELDATLRKTVFREARNNEEFLALCFIAKEYQLNPLLKEIYAFPAKGGGVVPLVGVDGYISMMHRQADFDGMEFRYSEETAPIGNAKAAPVWVEAVVYKKNCQRPTVVREYMDECFRATEPWKTHPRRMLRHKALCQAVRLAFGFSGVYADADEAEPVAVQARVQEEPDARRQEPQDVNAIIEQAAKAQPARPAPQPAPAPKPRPAPKPAPKPAQKSTVVERVPLVEQEQKTAPAPAPEPVKAEPVQDPAPAVPDSRIRADIDEAFLDYVEGSGMDMARAEEVCRSLVDGKAAANMTEAHRLFVENRYTI